MPEPTSYPACFSRWSWLTVGLLGCNPVCPLWAGEPLQMDPVEINAAKVDDTYATTPTAVTVYDGNFLQEKGVGNYEALAPLVPGLFVSIQGVDSLGINLRGITTDTSDPNVQPRVTVFHDGVALTNTHGNNVALFDMDNVNLFKGPQPTEFGRGVQSGALVLTSNRAVDETSGEFTAGAGEFNSRSVQGYVNAPLVDQKLFGRVAITLDQSDGFIRNLADGSDLQGRDTVALRTSLRWQPSAATTADLIFNLQHDTPPGIDFKNAVIPTAPVGGNTNPYTAANLTRGSALGIDRTITGLTGVIRHELNQDWAVTSTSAARRVHNRDEFDADGSFLYLLEPGEDFVQRQLSQEVRFEYDAGERLSAMIGGGVAHEKNIQDVTLRTNEDTLFSFLTGFPSGSLPGAINRYSENYKIDAESTSLDLFGRTDYKLTPKLTIGAGLRLTRENIVSGYQSFASATPGNVGLLPASGGGNDFFRPTAGRLETDDQVYSWSGKVDASYAFRKNLTGYVSVSRGRHAPVLGFNQATLLPFELQEETVWNYEAGIKGTLAEARIRYELSVFQYYFDHFQTQRVIGPGLTTPVDGGRARGQGFEATLQGEVMRNLTLFGSYGFTDATFSALDEDGLPQAFAGDTPRLTARHTLSVGGTLRVPAGDRGAVFITPVLTYKSEHFFEDDNSQNGGTLLQGGYTLVNLRIVYRPNQGVWELAAYADNLFDKNYLIDAGNLGGGFGIPTNVPGAPRTVGVKATVRF